MKAIREMDRNSKSLYTAIGQALDTWAIIEAHLCSIFAVAVSAKEYAPAAAAFSAIISFEAQIDMVHAAMASSFAPTSAEFGSWSAIKKKLDKLRPTRNRLAHGKVVPVTMKGGAMEFRYLPFYHFFTHKEREEFAHLDLSDIQQIQKDFGEMVKTLAEFGRSVGARQQIKPSMKLLIPKSPAPSKKPGQQKA
jgi:hypothetical protein